MAVNRFAARRSLWIVPKQAFNDVMIHPVNQSQSEHESLADAL
jgi:hypothetical protein